ncbi:leupaxin isoform 2-T2 [Guaruba guarouba]
MEDLDALLEELEQSSREAHGLQAPSARVPPLARLEVQLPRAQPPTEAVDTVYSSPVAVPQPLFPSSPPTAAAQQLDKLLADLGHMQSKSATGGQRAQEPEETEPKPSLDNMLGSLTRDLQELGITATPTSVCTSCHKPIAGKVLTALGRTWHPEHFTCARCGQELGAQPFFERDGQPYCEDDYHQAFAPCCAYCAGPIREVRLLQPPLCPTPTPLPHPASSCRRSSRRWTRPGTPSTSSAPTAGRCLEMMVHPRGQAGGFCPAQGNPQPHPTSSPAFPLPPTLSTPMAMTPCTPPGFLVQGGRPYCRQDFLAMFAPKCQGCERPVTGSYLSALKGAWHPECFVCTDCLSGFSSGSFFELEGRPYCEQHFHQRQGSICHGCGRPVTGRCVTAAGRKYHPEHFTCTYCLRPLHKGTVRERGSKMYCQACHDKLFL